MAHAKDLLHACVRQASHRVVPHEDIGTPVSRSQASQARRLPKVSWLWALLLLVHLVLARATTGTSVAWQPCRDESCDRTCNTHCDCPSTAPYCKHFIDEGTSKCLQSPRLPERPFFFVHNPKTGGTTLRYIAEVEFRRARMCLIYPTANSTSPFVVEELDRRGSRNDPANVARFVQAAVGKCSWIGGHLSGRLFLRPVGLRRVISIVRDPVDRLISAYYVTVRSMRVAGGSEPVPTFEWLSMVRLEKMWREWKLPWQLLEVQDVPPQAYGFIGITERYDEGLAMFNQIYTVNFTYTEQKNHNTVRDEEQRDKHVDLPITDKMMALLQPDVKLYKLLAQVFEQRKRLMDDCKPFAHGAIDDLDSAGVRGFAWWAHSDDPVMVTIRVNGVEVGRSVASKEHFLVQWGAPRDGFVGYSYRFQQPLRARDVVQVHVTVTGQFLGEIKPDGTGEMLWRNIAPSREDMFLDDGDEFGPDGL